VALVSRRGCGGGGGVVVAVVVVAVAVAVGAVVVEVVVEGAVLAEGFGAAQRRWVARASRQSWYLVTGPAAPACVTRGAKGRTS
jgi:hypothetical protein